MKPYVRSFLVLTTPDNYENCLTSIFKLEIEPEPLPWQAGALCQTGSFFIVIKTTLQQNKNLMLQLHANKKKYLYF